MPFVYDAPLQNPLRGGLFSAANIVSLSDPSRLSDGVKVRTFNCGQGFGVWNTLCGAEGNPTKDGDRAPDEDFFGFAVWAADECGLKRKDEASAAAQQALRLHEQQLVEAEFAAKLLADAGAAVAPAAGEVEEFVRAVGEIDDALGYLPGVIHADAHFAAWAQHLNLRVGANGAFTPMGHRWAFSVGYSALGNRLIGTGPVTVFQGSVGVVEGLGVQQNSRLMVAEREYGVAYECGIVAREVAV